MGTYQIEWKSSALRELKRLDRQIVPRIVATIETLSSNPFPQGVKKLHGGDLFEHAIELFFKGAIMSATGKPAFGHDLSDLFDEFKNLYGYRFTFESEIDRFAEGLP